EHADACREAASDLGNSLRLPRVHPRDQGGVSDREDEPDGPDDLFAHAFMLPGASPSRTKRSGARARKPDASVLEIESQYGSTARGHAVRLGTQRGTNSATLCATPEYPQRDQHENDDVRI